MARIKNPSPSLRRRSVAMITIFLSIALTAFALLYLLDYKSEGIGIFKTKLDKTTKQFETTEKQYNKILTELTTTRTSVSDYTLTLLEDAYQDILTNLISVTGVENQQVPLQLTSTIQERKNSIERLRIMNRTIQWEEIVGTQLSSYDTCIKKINYQEKPAKILSALKECSVEIGNAKASSINLPPRSIAFCDAKKTPYALIEKKLAVHKLFIDFYTATSQNRAKDAANLDLQYQKALYELDQSPNWNDCITTYLETEAEVLSR
ncbi:hypothetical protein IT418_01275 [bacterium]|nr:hypothetical protein [bacterium]